MQAGWLPGNTIFLDFPFAAFPENIGHWQEILLPIYNMLSSSAWLAEMQGGSKYVDTVFMLNLRRDQLRVRQVQDVAHCQRSICPKIRDPV